MNKLLEDAFAEARELPDDEQERIANILYDALHDTDEDRRWDALLESPASIKMLEKMSAEARASVKAGDVFPLPGDKAE